MIDRIIDGLGSTIPEFALDRADARMRYIEAWLLIYELLDQSSHAALDSGVATGPLVVDVLAERFLLFLGAN